jgi:CRP/FNR family transcriptional regulator
MKAFDQLFPHLKPDLKREIKELSEVAEIPSGTQILKEGQFVAAIPIVLNGLVKVYTKCEDRELLLYYIQPSESCVMSFSSAIRSGKSRVYAVTEEDTRALMIPASQIDRLTRQYPSINTLFFDLYNSRYVDLLDTIHHVLFNKLDERVLQYLEKKSSISGSGTLKLTHQQIANEVGTAREVISRILKKLEAEGTVSLSAKGIEIL